MPSILLVLEALNHESVLETYANTVTNIYKDIVATIVLLKKSRKIPIEEGIRQGDLISPMFTACLEVVFKKLELEEIGIRIDEEHLGRSCFAYDSMLFSNDGKMIQDLNWEGVKAGMKMEHARTKHNVRHPRESMIV